MRLIGMCPLLFHLLEKQPTQGGLRADLLLSQRLILPAQNLTIIQLAANGCVGLLSPTGQLVDANVPVHIPEVIFLEPAIEDRPDDRGAVAIRIAGQNRDFDLPAAGMSGPYDQPLESRLTGPRVFLPPKPIAAQILGMVARSEELEMLGLSLLIPSLTLCSSFPK